MIDELARNKECECEINKIKINESSKINSEPSILYKLIESKKKQIIRRKSQNYYN